MLPLDNLLPSDCMEVFDSFTDIIHEHGSMYSDIPLVVKYYEDLWIWCRKLIVGVKHQLFSCVYESIAIRMVLLTMVSYNSGLQSYSNEPRDCLAWRHNREDHCPSWLRSRRQDWDPCSAATDSNSPGGHTGTSRQPKFEPRRSNFEFLRGSSMGWVKYNLVYIAKDINSSWL